MNSAIIGILQMFPRGGRVYRYPGGRSMPDSPMPGGGMMYDMGGLPVRDGGISQSIPIGALASALANANPEMQRTVSFSFRSFPLFSLISLFSFKY